MHGYAQNLNRDDDGRPIGPWWKNFRAWLHPYLPKDILSREDGDAIHDALGWKADATLGMQCVMGWSRMRDGFSWAASIMFGEGLSDHEAMIHLEFGPVALFVWIEHYLRHRFPRFWRRFDGLDRDREVALKWHHGRLWWRLWVADQYHYADPPPAWRSGSFSPMDALFGHYVHENVVLEESAASIPMNERTYPCVVRFEQATWRRRRFPWWPLAKRRMGYDVEIDRSIPIPGKGENSWDQGPDGLSAISFSSPEGLGFDLDFAIRYVRESVMRDRRARSGNPDWQPA